MISWLFCASILIRNAYTSALYSYITKDPGPTKVPSYNEIIRSSDIQFISDLNHLVSDTIDRYFTFVKNTLVIQAEPSYYISVVTNLSIKLSLTNHVANISNAFSNDIEYGIECQDLRFYNPKAHTNKVKTMIDMFNQVKYNLKPELLNSTCLNSKIFAYLFVRGSSVDMSRVNSYVNKLLLFSNSAYYKFEGKDAIGISLTSFWNSHRSFYDFERLRKMFSNVVESGIMRYMQTTFDVITMRRQFFWSKNSEDTDRIRQSFFKWQHFNCFETFREECSLDEIDNEEILNDGHFIVHVDEIKVVWVLYSILNAAAVLLFFNEMFSVYRLL